MKLKILKPFNKNFFLILGSLVLFLLVNQTAEGSPFDYLDESDPNFAYSVLTANCTDSDDYFYTIETEIIEVSKINIETGSYDLEFYVKINDKNKNSNFIETLPPIEYINKEPEDLRRLGDHILTSQFMERRQGTFSNDFNFTNYPFEKLDLVLEIQPKVYEICEMILWIESPKDVYSDLKIGQSISGYKIVEFETKASIEKELNKEYSRVTLKISLEKPVPETFLQYIFPVFLLSFLAIMVYFITKNPFQKIELNALFLVSMVFYSQLVKFQNTFITDFTIFDIIVSISYGIFLVTIIISGIQLKRAKKTEA